MSDEKVVRYHLHYGLTHTPLGAPNERWKSEIWEASIEDGTEKMSDEKEITPAMVRKLAEPTVKLFNSPEFVKPKGDNKVASFVSVKDGDGRDPETWGKELTVKAGETLTVCADGTMTLEEEHPGRWPVSVDWADPEATIIDPSYGVPLAKEERERLQQARDYILQVERERDHFYTYNKANHEELERVFDEKEKFVQEIAELKAREVELEKSAKFTNAVMEDVNEELEK